MGSIGAFVGNLHYLRGGATRQCRASVGSVPGSPIATMMRSLAPAPARCAGRRTLAGGARVRPSPPGAGGMGGDIISDSGATCLGISTPALDIATPKGVRC